ncbi:MAPK/MAK/MRK overlapping kinase [Tritrichomonas foetus]|uniref:MAPK/MAK/MRK overlapping kinase n=1 Tax=Tritrichomonas foetus TaxID=1144522 RepID=A0A1J4J4V0_9EUKA|nr:MAPK/MAK/MRK overlapping kinase [Tritrichomonas foetus]|eukprot:OHS92699.1 MAPK/MAK/MRK overlapping kinase [Tritrichomonas foetus]
MYALKVMKDRFRTLEQIKNNEEIQVMQRIGYHTNIVGLQEVIFEPEKYRLTLVMDLMECNLLDMIAHEKVPLSMKECLSLTYQLFSALSHVHKLGYIHRDIKPENCLVNSSTLELKLADFGSTRTPSRDSTMTEYIATRWYRPPECLLTSGDYGSALDVWAVGCVFYELLTKMPLFPGNNSIDQLQRIHSIMGAPDTRTLSRVHASDSAIQNIKNLDSKHSGLKSLLPTASDEVIDLFNNLLAYVPDDRISAEDALKHPAFDIIREDFIKRPYSMVIESAPVTSPVHGERPKIGRMETNNNNNKNRRKQSQRNNQSRLQQARARNPRILVPKNRLVQIGKPNQQQINHNHNHIHYQGQQQRMGGYPTNIPANIKLKPQSVLCQGSMLPGIHITHH